MIILLFLCAKGKQISNYTWSAGAVSWQLDGWSKVKREGRRAWPDKQCSVPLQRYKPPSQGPTQHETGTRLCANERRRKPKDWGGGPTSALHREGGIEDGIDYTHHRTREWAINYTSLLPPYTCTLLLGPLHYAVTIIEKSDENRVAPLLFITNNTPPYLRIYTVIFLALYNRY